MADEGLLGPADIRAIAARLGVRPTKTLGQNFLHDPNTIRRIIRTAELTYDDVTVEVGPGLGSLTLGLLPACRRLTAIEIDPVLAAALPATVDARLPDYADRLYVVTADALQIDGVPGPPPTALVANLPYNVAVPVVLHLLEVLPSLVTVLVMVQAEVADRLAAPPGSKVYGVPSAKAAWYANVRRAGAIPRTVFWPMPNVDSGLVRMVHRDPPSSTRRSPSAARPCGRPFPVGPAAPTAPSRSSVPPASTPPPAAKPWTSRHSPGSPLPAPPLLEMPSRRPVRVEPPTTRRQLRDAAEIHPSGREVSD